MMPGTEYLTAEVLRALWDEIGEAFSTEHAESGATLQEFLKRLSPAWNLVERALQPRREPQGRASALRLPRDLHEPALGTRPGPRAPGLGARVDLEGGLMKTIAYVEKLLSAS